MKLPLDLYSFTRFWNIHHNDTAHFLFRHTFIPIGSVSALWSLIESVVRVLMGYCMGSRGTQATLLFTLTYFPIKLEGFHFHIKTELSAGPIVN